MTWLSYRNWIDAAGASFIADVEASEDLVAANLAQRQVYKVWRTDGLQDGNTDAGVTIDFGQVRQVQALGLMFPRTNDPDLYDETPYFIETDTIRHRLDAVTPETGAIYDSGVVASGVLAGYGVHTVLLPAPVSARYWRIDLDAPSRATEGFIDLGRAWAGPALLPRVGHSYGDDYQWASDSLVARASRGVSDFVDSIDGLRSWTLPLDWIDDSERMAWMEFDRLMTTVGQFLICRHDMPDGTNNMFARQAQSAGLGAASFQRSRKSLRLIESI